MDGREPHIRRDQEITLRDVIIAIQDHVRELFRSFWLIFLFALLGITYYLVDHFRAVTTYEAECTFMVNEQDQTIGISSILGEFGLGSQSEFKLEKIAELARTRAMTQRVMFSEVESESGKSDWLANYFIDVLRAAGDWEESSWWGGENPLAEFKFTHDSVEIFERLENKALRKINEGMNDRLETSINEISGILTFKFVSRDETVSYEVLDRLYLELSQYYTDKSVEKQLATFQTLESKCDSLEAVLNSKEYQLAQFQDTRRGQWLNVEQTPQDKLYREIRMLSIMYGEALKNKEMAAFSLANVRPFIQVIDQPIYPLKKHQSVWWIKFIVGGFVGGLVGVAFVVLRKVYREAMAT